MILHKVDKNCLVFNIMTIKDNLKFNTLHPGKPKVDIFNCISFNISSFIILVKFGWPLLILHRVVKKCLVVNSMIIKDDLKVNTLLPGKPITM